MNKQINHGKLETNNSDQIGEERPIIIEMQVVNLLGYL